jgi:surfactin synthase thioesterase subunit
VVDARWFVPLRRRDEPAALLFCLPYAGGSAAAFRQWTALLDRLDIEVLAVELPGHGRRIGESPRLDVAEIAAALAAAVDRPYVLFGHSLGARLAFEVCRHLRDRGSPEPVRLCVSGTPGPRLDRVGRGDSRLPDADFVTRVQRMGGTPAAVLGDPELRALFLPVVRSDFAWGDDYEYRPGPPLTCPISAFAGAADPEAPPDQVATWAAETTGPTRLHIVDGDHFFLQSHFSELADALVADLPDLHARPVRQGADR